MFRVMQLFRAAVEAFPSRPALWIEGRSAVTYAALWDAAEAVARRLRAAGAGRGSKVALGLEKSPEYVAAVWGCWLAGAAFCPLPPSLPTERRKEMLSRLAPLGIVSSGAADTDEGGIEGGIVRIAAAAPARRPWSEEDFEDEDASEPYQESPSSFVEADDAAGEDDLAYVIFTSGSTGRPKGVEVSHRGLPNLLYSQMKAFRLTSRSRSLFQSSIQFDAHLSDLGTALVAGAALCLERPARLADPRELLRLLHERRITHWDVPPSLLTALDPGMLPESLACLIFGGEPADPAAVRRLATRTRMVNVYGPTEATVCSSLCVCDAETWRRPLLGSPLPGIAYQVHDASGRPTAAGETGELWISGPCLALGYLSDPERTQERFPVVEGRRWYRTGDCVKEIARGEWAFLGRLDRQFKRRGRLVQPEEIEAALLTAPGVLAAAAFPVALPGERRIRLTAYVEGESAHGAISPCAIRAALASRLPAWMVPQRIEVLHRLPRTATGKVDYIALDSIARSMPADSAEGGCGTTRRGVAPAEDDSTSALPSALKTLRDVWRRVMELDHVGLDDDFADLGGDSVDAFHIAALAAASGVFVSPVEILQRRTLRACAAGLSSLPAEPRSEGGSNSASDGRCDDGLASDSFQYFEAFFANDIRSVVSADRNHVVLAGATGLLGRAVLRELLSTSIERIVCLARGADDSEASRRVDAIVAEWSEEERRAVRRRVKVLAADVAAAGWGLPPSAWEEHVAPAADLFHLAADLSLARDFKELEAVNVRSLRPALAAVRRSRGMRLHFASSLAVFASAEGREGRHPETAIAPAGGKVFGGYARSKQAAERLLADFEERFKLASVRIHRFSLLVDDSRAPRGGCDQHARTLAGLLRLGCLPPIPPEAAVNLLAASAAARALVALRTAPSGAYHIAAPANLSFEEWLDLQPAEVRRLPRVSAAEFRRRGWEALAAAAGDRCAAEELSTAFFGFAQGWASREESDEGLLGPWDFFLSTGAVFETARTARFLREAGVRWERVDCLPRRVEDAVVDGRGLAASGVRTEGRME